MSKTRIIVLELNELTPVLMHRFIAAGALPNFSRLFSESLIYTTTAAERPPHLDPWIQWVTVHTGLNFTDHRIERLNEGHTLDVPRTWDLLSDAGRTVWICGSMSVGARQPARGAILPDPWTTSVRPHPASLEPFFSFVQRNVVDHTSAHSPVGPRESAGFLAFMASHGLSWSTVSALVRQLKSERTNGSRWMRATLLDKLQFDVFRWYYRKLQPEFSTFFLNSTAHFQHLYWREMAPDAFVAKPTEAQVRKYSAAIEYGYREMDRLVGRVFEMVDDETTIVLATALSQQPCLSFEQHGGKFFYRPTTFERLTSFAGIDAKHSVSPVMAHQFHLYFQTDHEARDAAARLTRLRYQDRQALAVELNGCGVFVGCRVYEPLAADARLAVEGESRSVPFFDIFYRVDGVKSGMHHPDGMLWIRTPARQHHVHAQHVPLDAVAPTILGLFGVDKPAYMAASLFAQPLVHAIAV